MTRNILYLFLFFCFISCGNPPLESKTIKSGFITESGIYYIRNLKHTNHRNILVKELKDESIIFAIRDSKNKILFQQSLNETFSKYNYWCLYVDEKSNVWFYNSDYMSSKAIIFNENTKIYETKDFCNIKLKLPKEFEKELKAKNLNCCSIVSNTNLN